jgi:hypothetical protein
MTLGSTILRSLLVLACTVVQAQIANQFSTGTNASAGSSLAYILDCRGKYLVLDSAEDKVLGAGIISELATHTATSRLDGCLLTAIQEDYAHNTIYAVVAVQEHLDSDGMRGYKVLALHLPQFELTASVNLSERSDEFPGLFLNRVTGKLTVTYHLPRSSGTDENVVQTYRIPGLEKILEVRKPTNNPDDSFVMSPNAFVGHRGEVVDGNRVLDATGRVTERITGESLLTTTVRYPFDSLVRTGANGRPYLSAIVADSAGGRMLFVLGWDRVQRRMPEKGGLLVYDAESKRTVSTGVIPYSVVPSELSLGTPNVHLSPDGKLVLVEQYDWRSTENERPKRFKTGNVAIYDADTGRFLRSIRLQPSPGFYAYILAFSPMSNSAYLVAEQNLYHSNLIGLERNSTIKMPEGFSPVAMAFSGSQ